NARFLRATSIKLTQYGKSSAPEMPRYFARASANSTSLPERANVAARLIKVALLEASGVTDRKVKTRGRGPASNRRSPSAWSKSKLAKRHPARNTCVGSRAHGVGNHQRQFVVMHFESRRFTLELEGTVDHVLRIGQMQVFWHTLAIG